MARLAKMARKSKLARKAWRPKFYDVRIGESRQNGQNGQIRKID